jgi:hypothetical protein
VISAKNCDKIALSREEYMSDTNDTIGKIQEARRRGLCKIESLACFQEVIEKLEVGETYREIAYFIQKERFEYTEAKPESIVVQISRWVQSKGKEYLGHRAPTKHVEMLKSLPERIDSIEALNLIFAIQFDRLMIDYSTETKINKCLNSNTNSLRLILDITRTIDEITDRKHVRPVPFVPNDSPVSMDRIRRDFEQRFGANAAMVALNPESRRRVFLALEKVKKGNLPAVQELLRRNTEIAKNLGYTSTSDADSKPAEEPNDDTHTVSLVDDETVSPD